MPSLFLVAKNGFLLSNFLLAVIFFFFDEPMHHKRNLGLWEKISHPIDSLCTGITYLIGFYAASFNSSILFWVYCFSAVITIIASYKDEFIHKQECSAKENLIHAAMFSLSGIGFSFGAFLILVSHQTWPFALGFTFAFFTMCWQIIFWFYLRDRITKQ